jgi:hypothetical protein
LQAEINSGAGWCHDGRHPLAPGTAFDVSHVMSVDAMKSAGMPEHEWHRPENLVASCRQHNRSAGGKVGAAKVNKQKSNESRTLNW